MESNELLLGYAISGKFHLLHIMIDLNRGTVPVDGPVCDLGEMLSYRRRVSGLHLLFD